MANKSISVLDSTCLWNSSSAVMKSKVKGIHRQDPSRSLGCFLFYRKGTLDVGMSGEESIGRWGSLHLHNLAHKRHILFNISSE